MHWYLDVLKKYALFTGRARRKEYWMFSLFNLVISFVLGFIDGLLGIVTPLGVGILGGVYTLAVLLPVVALTVRRLHDGNRSGWWCLIVLVPIAGPLALLVLMILEGTAGENRFGPNPKEATA
ncbi:MAG TPA: DUF805 domain-containing protein [Gammaproteobacteria bacterium]